MDHRPGGIAAPNTTTASPGGTTTETSSSTSSSSPSVSTTSHPSFQHVPTSMMEVDNQSAVEDRSRRATSVLSMDDIEAAQALEGLRSEYAHSPRTPSQQTPTTVSPTSDPKHPEPLLSLLTSTHPLISSAITGSMTAYTTSKSYSPRFKSGAEFIERTIGTPVAKSVGSVGRKTGVDRGLRWALQRKASNSSNANRTKRRKVNGEADVEKGVGAGEEIEEDGDAVLSHRVRSSSDVSFPETLPPYDDQKSPNYDDVGRERQSRQNWQSRLVISTSGLGVAMSEESLRSLQYCLTWLRWANGRLGKAMTALQGALKEWDDSRQHEGDSLLSQRIQAVREDVLSTLKQVVDVISKYAGGALPENARLLVRRHLTSLPHRFQVASTSNPPPDSPSAASDATVGAHRILVLAQEGLDMMAQVSGVVNDTLVSAELWCERLGRKRPSDSKNAAEAEQSEPPQQQSFQADVKQPILPEPETGDVQMTGMEKV